MLFVKKDIFKEINCLSLQKKLFKAIKERTRLRNKFFKNKYEQRNYCASLLEKSLKGFYTNLDEKSVIDNKIFWKTVKLVLSDKVCARDRIHLIEKRKIVKTELETA